MRTNEEKDFDKKRVRERDVNQPTNYSFVNPTAPCPRPAVRACASV